MGSKTLSLNGSWKFRTDPDGLGVQEQWYLYGFGGQEVTIPSVWQSYSKKMENYTGYAWYSKSFDFEKKRNERVFIKFDAVDYISDLWLNGQYIGSHEGGYVPFKFDISNALKAKENLLVLSVFDPEDNDEIPHGKQGSWYTRASGIWQDVNLISYGESFIENVKIVPNVDLEQVDFSIEFDSIENINNPIIQIDILSQGDELLNSDQFKFNKNEEFHSIAVQNAKLWDLENPYLYNVVVSLKDGEQTIDIYKSYFGMRKVETRDGKIYLNNKPLYIRGALDQAFWPKTIYRAGTEDMIKKEIQKAKDMGFNLLRKHIKTEDPRYLYWADRMGILIWAEPANYAKWTSQAKARFKKEYTDMVKRDFNHPAIIIWSIYNEEWGLEWKLRENKEMQDWLEEFYDYAKALDNTRLICDNSGWAHVKTDLNDHHRYFAVPENYNEWNYDLDQYVIAEPDKNFVKGYISTEEPLIISEFGIWGLPELDETLKVDEYPGWFRGNSRIFSEEFKIPMTAFKNFQKYKLNTIFADFNELALATQEREYRGVKYLFEEIRKREAIAGYVVTELSDIEWETNGFIKYDREDKSFTNKVNRFNGPLNIMLDIKDHNLWTTDKFFGTPYIVNNTSQIFDGLLKWELAGTDIKGSMEISVNSFSVNKMKDNIEFELLNIARTGKFELNYYLFKDGEKITMNSEELTVTSPDDVFFSDQEILTFNLKKDFGEKLIANGFNVNSFTGLIDKESYTHNLKFKKIILTDKLSKEVMDYIHKGGKAIFLAEEGSEIEDKAIFNFEELKDGESWDRTATFNFMNTEIFPDISLNKISGWEMADLYASSVISNLDDINYDRIIAGMFSGWIGEFGSSILELSMGKGKLIITTLKFKKQYNKQAIGTLLLNSMIKYLLG